MICCLCGHRFERGDRYVQVSQYEYLGKTVKGEDVGQRVTMEDGSLRKLACVTCPVMAGAPLVLIGAERGLDV